MARFAREPSIDVVDVKTGGLRATSDPDLLEELFSCLL
jgi:hypothetical protein